MSTLFPSDIPEAITQAELEKVQNMYPNYSKEFIASISIRERREWIEKMWSICEPYAEINFKTELATKGCFNQKTWELVIGSFLIKSGYSLLRRTGLGPDYLVQDAGRNIWVEATAPGVGEVDPAPERPEISPGEIFTGGGNIEITYRPKILRFISAIRNKSGKVATSQYSKGRASGLIDKGDCYVVAINGYDFSGIITDPFFLLRRSLFAAGCLVYKKNDDNTLAEGEYKYEPFVKKIKNDGAQETISTNIFTNKDYSEISAVIYSAEHIINMGTDVSNLGEKLFLVRNPYADNPLPACFSNVGHELVFEDGVIRVIGSI